MPSAQRGHGLRIKSATTEKKTAIFLRAEQLPFSAFASRHKKTQVEIHLRF